MQIGNFSINYQIIHIHRQNSVKFNTSNDIFFFICCVLTSHSHTKAASLPRTVQSSGEPLFRVKQETVWTTEGKGRGGALLGDWFSRRRIWYQYWYEIWRYNVIECGWHENLLKNGKFASIIQPRPHWPVQFLMTLEKLM